MAGPLNFKGYRDVLSLSTKGSQAAKAISKIEGVTVKWLGREKGALLPRDVAVDLADFIRRRLYSGEAFSSRTPGLSKKWQRAKQRMNLDPRMGIATGQMAEAIKAIRAGKGVGGGGTYSVGISSEARTSKRYVTNIFGRREKVGSIKKIQDYAYLLEFGGANQQPRPWFMPSVLAYFENKLPGKVEETLLSDLRPAFKRLAAAIDATWPEQQPEDLFQWRTGESPDWMSESPGARGLGETFGSPSAEEISGYQIEGQESDDISAKGSDFEFSEEYGVWISKVGDTWKAYFDMTTGTWRKVSEILKKKK